MATADYGVAELLYLPHLKTSLIFPRKTLRNKNNCLAKLKVSVFKLKV